MKIKVCLHPPPVHILCEELAAIEPPLGFFTKRKPDIKYALMCLATYYPEHEVFKPGYNWKFDQRSKKRTKYVDNTRQFLMPGLKSKAKRRTLHVQPMQNTAHNFEDYRALEVKRQEC